MIMIIIVLVVVYITSCTVGLSSLPHTCTKLVRLIFICALSCIIFNPIAHMTYYMCSIHTCVSDREIPLIFTDVVLVKYATTILVTIHDYYS